MTTLTIAPGPLNARTDPTTGLRSYTFRGQSYPSVTSIRRMAGVPHSLVAWQLSQVIKRATGDIDTLNAMLTRERKPRERVLEANRIAEAGRWLRAAATEERDRSAALGTAVHDAAASGLALDEAAEEVRPRLAMFHDFVRHTGATVLASEFQVVNTKVGYAGSVDAILGFPSGRIELVDYKTGSGVYAEHLLQIIAYANAEYAFRDDEVDGPTTDLLESITGIGLLHLADDGWDYRALDRDNGAWEAFRGLLTFARWMSDHPDAASITLAQAHEPALLEDAA